MSWKAVLSCAAVVCCLLVAACGGGSSGDTSTGSSTVTVWSSLPLQGPAEPISESIVNAERLALEEVGGRVGRFTVKYSARDDASASAQAWDPQQTSANARMAAQDKSTIAYLGDLDWTASAISIPILNEVGVLQVSPASTYAGLTKGAGGDKGEPEKYYPSGRRTFARVVPDDTVQARAQAAYQRDEGCQRLYVIADRQVDAAALAHQVAMLAPRDGIEVEAAVEADPNAKEYSRLGREVAASDADCAYVGWTGSDRDLQLLHDLNAAAPSLKLFVPTLPTLTAVAERLRGPMADSLYLTSPTMEPRLYPPEGQRFFTTYREKFGKRPDPYAIYGYEAMKLVLAAIEKAGDKGNDRAAVARALFELGRRNSVLGRYAIDQDGDTSLSGYGAYRVTDGELSFQRTIQTAS
jgi:branched-chain amino acid transport system substrate-binding protein